MNNELINVNVLNNKNELQYSFILDCELDSLPFREVIDETLAKGENGWSCTAQRLNEADDDLLLGC